jgi:hypothetical protein
VDVVRGPAGALEAAWNRLRKKRLVRYCAHGRRSPRGRVYRLPRPALVRVPEVHRRLSSSAAGDACNYSGSGDEFTYPKGTFHFSIDVQDANTKLVSSAYFTVTNGPDTPTAAPSC